MTASVRFRIVYQAFCVVILFCFLPLFSAFSDIIDDLDSYWQEVYDHGKLLTGNKEPLMARELLAKARPDACFYGIGNVNNVHDPENRIDCDHNKVNQAYVWGMTKTGDEIWFGTGANVHCLVSANYLGVGGDSSHGEDLWACEFESSRYLTDLLKEVPDLFIGNLDMAAFSMDKIGDWRPPKIYVYNVRTRTLTDKTPVYTPFLGLVYRYPETLANATIGIRSAATLNQVILLAGPSAFGGIDIYAFNSATGGYIGSDNLNALPGETLSGINNIRKWLVVDGQLYTAVGVTYSDGKTTGGKVLRWRGSLSNPFQFEVVGTLDSAGAELAFHEGRLFVSTWSGGGEMGQISGLSNMAGLYMSPLIPANGLTGQHKQEWIKAWAADDYEPDPLIAKTYGGGALASFDGYLYWGTMHVPALSYLTRVRAMLVMAGGSLQQIYFPMLGTRQSHYAYEETYNDPRNDLLIKATRRTISIFRGKNFGQDAPEIELLYGQKDFPYIVLTEDALSHAEESALEGYVEDHEIRYIASLGFMPNAMGGTDPLYGPAGLGNPYNNYTWTMSAHEGRLYLGTMNHAILLGIKEVPDDEKMAPSIGANLFYFASAENSAVAVNADGLGNSSNYGIRTIISDDALYLGTANPMNIMTNPEGKNIGGWELLKLGNWSTSVSGRGKIHVDLEADTGNPFIESLEVLDAGSPVVNQTGKPAGMKFPDGLVSFSIAGLDQPGDTVQVTLTFPAAYPEGSVYYKITDRGFEEFIDTTGAPLYAFNGNTVTLSLTDGDYWDKDGCKNGQIVDPGGASVFSSEAESPKKNSGGCFITSNLWSALDAN